jgi:signal transduction histidine kinase
MRLSELQHSERIGRATTDRPETLSGINRVQDLERILNVVKMINNSLVLDEVLRLVVDNSIDVAKAERGFLLLADNEGKLECKLARNSKRESLPLEEALISHTVVDDVHQTGESVFIENAQTDDHFDDRQSIKSLFLQTILCSPLNIKNEKVGVIYVDSRSIQAVKKDEIIDLFEILAGQAAIAIKNAQLYEKLHCAYKELEDANEQVLKFERMASRGEMAAEVSHELKNSLTIVSLQLHSLKSFSHRCSDEEREKKLNGAIEALKKTILFASGLIETSAFKTNKYRGDLNEAIRDFLKFIRILPRFRRSVLVTMLDESVPQFLFDKQQLQQVLLNLVTNAVEAYSEATIEIRTTYIPEKNEVRMSVIDNGPGIIDEVRKKIFTQKITTKVYGHGYGLPICRKIVENHNGVIEVESVVGQGTSFHLTFPAEKN